jgi:hypothetical protein
VIQSGAICYWNQGGLGTALAPTAGDLTALHAAGWDVAHDPDFIQMSEFDLAELPAGNTICPLWVDIPITTVEGETIRFEVGIYPSDVVTWVVKPSVQIIDLNVPWGGANEVLAHVVSTVESTAWEILSLSYACTQGQRLSLRITGTNTSTESVNFRWCWRQKMDYPVVGSVLSSDTVDGAAGTYHEATVAEVTSGVHFGAGSALVGEATGGGGGTTYFVI